MRQLFKRAFVQKTFVVVFILSVFFAIWALNYFFPIYADDMMYSVFKNKESFNLVKAIQETFLFLDLYYMTWGGRLVAHLVAFLLLFFSPFSQSIINTLCFLLLILFSYKLINPSKKLNLFLIVFLSVSFFYFTPSFLSSAIWKTGSANYLWMITLAVIFLYALDRSIFLHKQGHLTLKNIFLVGFLGIFAGCTNENLAPVLVLIVLVYTSIHIYKIRKIPVFLLLALIGLIIGCLIMILAPGNALRAEKEGYQGLFNSIEVMSLRLENIYASYRYFMYRPLMLYIIVFILFLAFAKQDINKKNVILKSLLFLIVANTSIWITIFSPSFPPRAFMSITILTFIAIGYLYANINFKKIIPLVFNGIFLLWLITFAGIDYVTFLKGSVFLNRVMEDREILIDRAKEQGKNNIYLEKVYLDYRFEYNDFANYYKDYYNLDVHFVEKDDPRLQE